MPLMFRSIAAALQVQIGKWNLKAYHVWPKGESSIDGELVKAVAAIHDQIATVLGDRDPLNLFLGYVIVHAGRDDDYVTVGKVGTGGEMITCSWTKKKGPDAPFRVVTRDEPGMCLWEATIHGHAAAAFLHYVFTRREPSVAEFLEEPFHEPPM